MGQAAEEQLTRDIENRRAELSRDIDALTDKVSPAQMVERRKAATRSRFSSMRDKVMGSAHHTKHKAASAGSRATESVQGTAHDAADTVERQTEGNPLAAGLVAFGAGWLASSLMPAHEKEAQAAQQLVERAKDHPAVDEAKSVGKQMGESLKESASGAAEEVKGRAQESAEHVKQEGQSSAEAVKQEGQDRAQHVQEDVKGRTT